MREKKAHKIQIEWFFSFFFRLCCVESERERSIRSSKHMYDDDDDDDDYFKVFISEFKVGCEMSLHVTL